MALTVNTLLNFSETPFKLKLVAGREGLKQTVSWIYYTEDPSFSEFIRGGELAITTGLLLKRKSENEGINESENLCSFLKDFIEKFAAHNASGLIVNTGKYIFEIPQEIKTYCDQINFPLFTMPWEIHTVDLMQEIGNMISADSQNSHNVEKFFYRAIFETQKFDPKQIENTVFHDAKSFSVALLELKENFFNNDIEQAKRYVQFSLNPKINFSQNDYCCFIHNRKVIYIIKNDNSFFAEELFRITRNDKFFCNSKLSISEYCASAGELEDAFVHAEITMNLSKTAEKLEKYDNLGIYKILLEVKNKKVLEQLYKAVLGNLDQLETAKREDYLKTLKLYLKLGGNIHSVSEQNNTHRNTVLYRLQRLQEILNVDLSDGDTRCLLQIAIYIKELLKK